MSYRVETASSARATCKNTECKNAGIKIGKDELRLGTWVEINGNGSWQWRHWGCVSGKILENIRNNLEGDGNEGSGVYRWDYLDGLYGEEKNSLDKNPDLQEKVKRVITQGFIDPEDWNGDPEMNKLGEKGTRTAESKKKARADKKKESEDLQAQDNEQKAENEALRSSNGGPAPKKKAASKKRAKEEDSDDEEEDFKKTEKPAKKKRATKAKKEEDEDDDLAQAKPAKKSRAKKSMKEEEDSEVELPANKSRVKKRESVGSPAPSIGNDWSKLSVSELKEELEKRKLPKSGKKSDLIARLEENEAEAEPSSPVKAEKEDKDSKRIKNEDFEDRAMADAPSSATAGTNIRSSPPNIPLAKAQKSEPAGKTVSPGKATVDSDTDDPISSVPVPKASKGKAARKISAPGTKSSTAPAPKIRRGRSNA